jgi:hypothetical protein
VKARRWSGLRASVGAYVLCVLAVQLGCPALNARLRPSPMLSRAADAAKPEPVDVAQLRARYREGPELRERCETERPLERGFALLDAGQWSALQALGASWLELCPIDIDFHRLQARALFVLGRKPESDEHTRWYRELVADVLASGDGASPESAYIVVSRLEEQALMRALDLTPLHQVWVADGLHGFEVSNATGQVSKIYFNPSTRMTRLFREFPLEPERDPTP